MEKTFKPWYKKLWGVLLIIFITLTLSLLVAFGLYVNDIVKSINSNGQTYQDITIKYNSLDKAEKEKIEGTGSFWTGSANPAVTIVEFSDFACPFCKSSFPKIREISLENKNVKYIFRNMPLHEESAMLAQAALCAGEQGLFWPMHDKLFLNQGVKTQAGLIELANKTGLDNDRFADCFEKEKYLKEINKDLTDGQDLKIKGTPTWFINGLKVEGDIPYNEFVELIKKF